MKLHKKKSKLNSHNPIATVFFYLVMTVFMLFALIPFYVIIATSLTSYQELTSTMSFVWWPKNGIDLSSYYTILFDDMFASTNVPTLILGFINTMWIALVTVTAQLFFSGLAAFAYSKLRFRWKNKVFLMELATMMIPTACMGITSFMFYRWLGWTDSYLPVVIPGMFGSATTIFFLRGFFDGIPTSLIEAAKIDGLGTFGCYLKIIMPLAKPAFMAQLIFAFVSAYNAYGGPLLYLTQDTQVTLQLALTQISNSYGSFTNIRCAAAVVGLVPMIVVFLACQKYFIEGIAAGSVKG